MLVRGLKPFINIAFINLKKPKIEPSSTPKLLLSTLYLSKYNLFSSARMKIEESCFEEAFL
jgi:hypothetical protein